MTYILYYKHDMVRCWTYRSLMVRLWPCLLWCDSDIVRHWTSRLFTVRLWTSRFMTCVSTIQSHFMINMYLLYPKITSKYYCSRCCVGLVFFTRRTKTYYDFRNHDGNILWEIWPKQWKQRVRNISFICKNFWSWIRFEITHHLTNETLIQ